MKLYVVYAGVLCLVMMTRVDAWGGLFNRFSPEMLANLGYGGHGGSLRPQPFLQDEKSPVVNSRPRARRAVVRPLVMCLVPLNGRLQAETYGTEEEPFSQESEEPCYGRQCTANEHCCPGQVCVDVDGAIGNCLFVYGRKIGELCHRDSDCESGLVCFEGNRGGASVCRPPTATAKQYAEDCASSTDCDVSRGLCCQLQRRHRQAPRKVCSYFKDPLVCIGTVAADQVKADVQHTAGEKRITYKHPGIN